MAGPDGGPDVKVDPVKTTGPETKGPDGGQGKKLDPAIVRQMALQRLRDAKAKGEDPAAVRDSLKAQMPDAAAVIDAAFQEVTQSNAPADKTTGGDDKKAPATDPKDDPKKKVADAQKKAPVTKDPKGGDGKKGPDGKEKKDPGKDEKKEPDVKQLPAALQDIAVASQPGADGKLPGFQESLGSDLQKYGSEKAWHDAWKSGGSKSAEGGDGMSMGDRGALVLKALGKGVVTGGARGILEGLIGVGISTAGKKIPYLSGFIEIAQIAWDPKKWWESNAKATAGKFSKGWSQLTGGGDFFTRLEGLISLIDGVANVVGLLGTICQVVAAVLFVGGLILSIFGVGAALLAAAPFLGKAGLVLSEVSALLKIVTMGLRVIVIAGRAYQIMFDKNADPEALREKAASLEKNSEEWTKEFAKTKTKKWAENKLKPKTAGGKDNAKGAGGGKGGGGTSKPDKPSSMKDRILNIAKFTVNVATGGRQQEMADKYKVAKEQFIPAVTSPGKTLRETRDAYSQRRDELKGQVQQTNADVKQGIQDKGVIRGTAEGIKTAYKDARDAVNYTDRKDNAAKDVKEKEQKLDESKKELERREGNVKSAQEEADAIALRRKQLELSLNSKRGDTAGGIVGKQQDLKKVEGQYQNANRQLDLAKGDVTRQQGDVQQRQSDLESARSQQSSSTKQNESQTKANGKDMLGNVAKDGIKAGAQGGRDLLVSAIPDLDTGKNWAKEKAAELEQQHISLPSKLPDPPVGDEAAVDAEAAKYDEAVADLEQIAFQRKTLEEMKGGAEEQKTGLDVLNKLAEANKAQTDKLKQESEQKGQTYKAADKKAEELKKSDQDMQSGGAKKTNEFVPFLTKLAGILGMVPSGMADGAGDGAAGAQKMGPVVSQIGDTTKKTGPMGDKAGQTAKEAEQVRKAADQKTAAGEQNQAKLLADRLAAEAELKDGKTMIAQTMAQADAKKKEKEAEKSKAQQEYANAKKRLLGWAIMHESVRQGHEQSLDDAINQAEQQLGQQNAGP